MDELLKNKFDILCELENKANDIRKTIDQAYSWNHDSDLPELKKMTYDLMKRLGQYRDKLSSKADEL